MRALEDKIRKERFIVIDGPSRDDLTIIFQLQCKEDFIDPPFATFRIKRNCESENMNLELDLAFYPVKLEYADSSGDNFHIAGYLACISTKTGRRASLSQIYCEGYYDSASRIGSFTVDRKAYKGSEFRGQLHRQLDEKVEWSKRRRRKKTAS